MTLGKALHPHGSYAPKHGSGFGFADTRGYRTATPTPSTTPTQHSWMGVGYAGLVGPANSSDNLYGLADYERPLPPRRPAHGRGSVDLVTPFAVGN